jgi:hypothetical protein
MTSRWLPASGNLPNAESHFPSSLVLGAVKGAVAAHSRDTNHTEIKKLIDLSDAETLLMQHAGHVAAGMARAIFEGAFVKVVPTQGCNAVRGEQVAPAINIFAAPLTTWNCDDKAEHEIIKRLTVLTQEVRPQSAGKINDQFDFLENTSERQTRSLRPWGRRRM